MSHHNPGQSAMQKLARQIQVVYKKRCKAMVISQIIVKQAVSEVQMSYPCQDKSNSGTYDHLWTCSHLQTLSPTQTYSPFLLPSDYLSSIPD
jgi:hypothetical protein